jgi:hypothetical protein
MFIKNASPRHGGEDRSKIVLVVLVSVLYLRQRPLIILKSWLQPIQHPHIKAYSVLTLARLDMFRALG